MALLQIGDSATHAQKRLCLDLTGKMTSLLDTLPTAGSSAVPSAAQVLCFRRHPHAPLQLLTALRTQQQPSWYTIVGAYRLHAASLC
jgi:hypothetical protein